MNQSPNQKPFNFQLPTSPTNHLPSHLIHLLCILILDLQLPQLLHVLLLALNQRRILGVGLLQVALDLGQRQLAVVHVLLKPHKDLPQILHQFLLVVLALGLQHALLGVC